MPAPAADVWYLHIGGNETMIKLAYILAASHSGSTLTNMLLASHESVATVGEMKLTPDSMGDVSRYRCSCGDFIQQCRFWHKVREGMAARGFEFDVANAGTDYRAGGSAYARWLLRPLQHGILFEGLRDAALRISPIWQRQCWEIQGRNTALISTVAEITGAKIVADSSKIASRLKYLLQNTEFEIKVIRLIRDGRAVALTYMDPTNFADARDPSMHLGGDRALHVEELRPMAQAAYQWRRCNEDAENLLRTLDQSQFISVHYEGLCEDTENTLSRLFEFLGLDPSKRASNFRDVDNHIVGNGMRLDTSSQVELDERWRQVLTDEDLRVFDDVAGELNRRYGYH